MARVGVVAGESRMGERTGLGALYVRHGPSALALAYLLTGDRALAEDLTQEAFARVVGRFAHLRDPEAFPAYLRKTVLNLARSHFRRKRLERSFLRREQQQPREEGVEYNLDVREDVWQALQLLPERQRLAIVLHFYEDLSDDEASDVLRCRPGTYRSLVSRGVKALREQIQGEMQRG
jgi:RNA polymerase sigma-70 factor (sigma-E family)